MLENSKTFEAYVRIDCSYFLLQKMQDKLSAPKSPINKMIDTITGFGQAEFENQKKGITEIIEQIIDDKKLIGADYSNDEEVLAQFKQLETRNPKHNEKA